MIIDLLTQGLNLLLPNSSTFVIKDLLRSKKLESKLLILLKRIYLARYKQGQ